MEVLTISDPLQTLRSSPSPSEEVIALEALQARLKPAKDRQNNAEPDEEWLAMAADNLGDDDDDDVMNPFPSTSPEQLLTSRGDLRLFTCYVFMRRFGWSEGINGESITGQESVASGAHHHNGSLVNHHHHHHHHHQRGKMAMMEKEVQFKGRLNELLDEFIKW